MNCGLVVAYKINIVIIDICAFSVAELFFFYDFDLSIFFATYLCLSFEQFCFEIFLFQLFECSLSDFSLFQIEVTRQILYKWRGTLAEQERVGMYPLLTVSLRPQAGFHVGLWAVVIMNFIIDASFVIEQMRFIRNIVKYVGLFGCAAYVPMRLYEKQRE